jgi:hypothetical protein
MNIESVLSAYETAACWSSIETVTEGGEPLDNYMAEHDTAMSEACHARMRADVTEFLARAERAGIDLSCIDFAQVGHDFWLTRNGPGAGFWDRDAETYGTAEVRDALDVLAHTFPEVSLYVSDNNTVEHE